MKKWILTAFAAMSIGGTAYANCCSPWDGFYIGATGGYTWANAELHTSTEFSPTGYFATTSVTAINAVGSKRVHPKGFNGGIVAGYNLQWCSFLLGLETEFDAFVLRNAHSVTLPYPGFEPSVFTVSQSIETDWLYTLRPRLGWTMCNWLIYATGGLAVTRLKYQGSFRDTFDAPKFGARENGSVSKTKTGWTVGGGLEYALNRCWTVKAEYLYVKFNDIYRNSSIIPSTADGFTNPFHHSTDLTANNIRLGINLHI